MKRKYNEIFNSTDIPDKNIIKTKKTAIICKSFQNNKIYMIENFDPSMITKIEIINKKKFPKIDNYFNLCKIIIKNCHFTEIPKYILNSDNLLEIKIIDSLINNIPVNNCKYLRKLHIINTPISTIFNFSYNLQKLILINTSISDLPKLPYNLQVIIIDGGNLEKIPESIYGTISLRHLQITNNKIKYIPDKINKLYELKTLDLHKNSIYLLNPLIQFSSYLKYLDLSENYIHEFNGKIISRCKLLKEIYLQRNKMYNISISDLNNLKYLDLSCNYFTDLKLLLNNLSFRSLVEVNISDNNFKNKDTDYLNCLNCPFIKLNFNQAWLEHNK